MEGRERGEGGREDGREREREGGRKTDRQTETDRQTDRQTDRDISGWDGSGRSKVKTVNGVPKQGSHITVGSLSRCSDRLEGLQLPL